MLTASSTYRLAAVRGDFGAFDAHTAQMRTDFALNTRFSIIAIAQYDNDSRQLGLNVRAVYEVREGTNLYVVLNHRGSRPALRKNPFGTTQDQAVLVKFTYRLNLP